MISEAMLQELRVQADQGRARRPVKFVEIDPRVLKVIIDELERHRLVRLIVETPKRLEPALRD